MPALSTVACVVLSGLAAVTGARRFPYGPKSGPHVDLGYEVYTAASFDEPGGYYNFSNIRYAAPPTGNLRFAKPARPERNRSAIQDGSVGRICPQAGPAWGLVTQQFLPLYLQDPLGFNISDLPVLGGDGGDGGAGQPPAVPTPDPRETEDCLFLDVFVPASVYHSQHRRYGGRRKGAKVLVWVHGGGFVLGDKYTTPGGLLELSDEIGDDGPIVYVSMNYRLGAFGWSSGPSFEAAGGVSNVGLYDQRMALEWVRHYIHLFGGDGDDITVIGESAGGSSIMHQITAFGGAREAGFNRAIIQSPGFFPAKADAQGEKAYQRFLELTGSSSLEDLRALPSEAVVGANALQVGLDSLYGQFTYGPTVGDSIVPDLPGRLLQQGRFDRSIDILTGYNTNEGLTFTNPFVTTDDQLTAYLQAALPRATQEILSTIQNELYPPVFDGSAGYIDQISRLARIIADSGFVCNTRYLQTAFDDDDGDGSDNFGYVFAVPPGLHGQDVPYTYYTGDGEPTADVQDVAVATELQRYVVSFAETGRPEGAVVSEFPVYGEGDGATVVVLGPDGIVEAPDGAAGERCVFWQAAPYF